MTYFDGENEMPALEDRQIDEEAWLGSLVKKISKCAKQENPPALLSIRDDVWLAWLEKVDANQTTQVMGMTSADGGETWSNAKMLLSVKGKVDYPKLLRHKGKAYLAVNTVDGLKVMLM